MLNGPFHILFVDSCSAVAVRKAEPRLDFGPLKRMSLFGKHLERLIVVLHGELDVCAALAADAGNIGRAQVHLHHGPRYGQ